MHISDHFTSLFLSSAPETQTNPNKSADQISKLQKPSKPAEQISPGSHRWAGRAEALPRFGGSTKARQRRMPLPSAGAEPPSMCIPDGLGDSIVAHATGSAKHARLPPRWGPVPQNIAASSPNLWRGPPPDNGHCGGLQGGAYPDLSPCREALAELERTCGGSYGGRDGSSLRVSTRWGVRGQGSSEDRSCTGAP